MRGGRNRLDARRRLFRGRRRGHGLEIGGFRGLGEVCRGRAQMFRGRKDIACDPADRLFEGKREIVERLLPLLLACFEIDFDGIGQIEHDGAQHGAAQLHHFLMVTPREKQDAFADELQRDLFENSGRGDTVTAAVPLRIEAELTAHFKDRIVPRLDIPHRIAPQTRVPNAGAVFPCDVTTVSSF